MFAGIGYARHSAKAAAGLGAQLRQMNIAVWKSLLCKSDKYDSSLVTRLTSDVTIIQNASDGHAPVYADYYAGHGQGMFIMVSELQ